MKPSSSSFWISCLVISGSWFALVQLSLQICKSGTSSCILVFGSHKPTGCILGKAPDLEVGLRYLHHLSRNGWRGVIEESKECDGKESVLS